MHFSRQTDFSPFALQIYVLYFIQQIFIHKYADSKQENSSEIKKISSEIISNSAEQKKKFARRYFLHLRANWGKLLKTSIFREEAFFLLP